jgi:hypothetical protein
MREVLIDTYKGAPKESHMSKMQEARVPDFTLGSK